MTACFPECICRLAGSEGVSVVDALACLTAAVGPPVSPPCDCVVTTTSTTLPGPAGSCEVTGAACRTKFDCEEQCFGPCEATRDACKAVAQAVYAKCYPTCLPDDLVCPRACVLALHHSQVLCGRTHESCVKPCDRELCAGVHIGERFEDTGLTIIDHQTRLEWEKKTDDQSSLKYSWSRDSTSRQPDGTLFTSFLPTLNNCRREGGCFAGKCDWRLPSSSGLRSTGERAEIESIQREAFCTGLQGCIHPLFGPISRDAYWTSTEEAPNSKEAWAHHFIDVYSRTDTRTKYHPGPARAVRDLP